ncbi:hypothetical protein [Melittangium boletus]|uniref:Lipoprotein n=1 Tax=Melittangium boletus DSM 14713 TaxID=1294270 RepID=A0A250I9K1_9BACT|nr:hypothetical protein [Melittangium boletus]ATB27832.1 hypothetical protein MEBOL_001277 [Melittangium boletus DSM 14713]
MTRAIRLMVVSVMSLGLAACGGAKLGGGKEGAAQAAFQASQGPGRGHSKTGQALVERAMASGATSDLKISATCAHSGSASLTLQASTNPGEGLFSYAVSYDACNEDGVNEYDGTLTTTMGITLDPKYMGFGFFVAHKGKITIDGEISDSLDMDVKIIMDVSATSARSGSVKLVFDGTIKTDEGTYTYANETIVIVAGELPKA